MTNERYINRNNERNAEAVIKLKLRKYLFEGQKMLVQI